MLRFLVDENFDNTILRDLRRRNPAIDVIRAQDVGLSATDDRIVLSQAAKEGRILLTHDVATVMRFAYERVKAGLPMPGVFEVDDWAPIGKIVEDLLLLAECSRDGEWEGQILFVPLKS
jgi:hypothetical protein